MGSHRWATLDPPGGPADSCRGRRDRWTVPPTLVLLHGLTGSGDSWDQLVRVLGLEDWTVVTPDGPLADPRGGFAWWPSGGPPVRRPLSAEALAAVEATRAHLETLIETAAPSGPLIVGGFSQGAAMALELLRGPLAGRIAGLIHLSGPCVDTSRLATSLWGLAPGRVLGAHGRRDEHVAPLHSEAVRDALRAAAWEVEWIEHSHGHRIPREVQDGLKAWFRTWA